jgi:hypothetical protein
MGNVGALFLSFVPTPLPSYLLDVSALIALGVRQHHFHVRLAAWVETRQFASLFTCPITELGFLRILGQTPAYAPNLDQARPPIGQPQSKHEIFDPIPSRQSGCWRPSRLGQDQQSDDRRPPSAVSPGPWRRVGNAGHRHPGRIRHPLIELQPVKIGRGSISHFDM